jgi:hypothetical protein
MWILSINTESGDTYGPFVFENKPDDRKSETFLKERFPDEWDVFDDGPGIFNSYMHIKWTEIKEIL